MLVGDVVGEGLVGQRGRRSGYRTSHTAYVAETQWSLAVPFSTEGEGWEPVLRLLSQGMSDKAIAVALGTSMRTVQRRINAAMDDLGAGSRFELGFVYSRHQGARG